MPFGEINDIELPLQGNFDERSNPYDGGYGGCKFGYKSETGAPVSGGFYNMEGPPAPIQGLYAPPTPAAAESFDPRALGRGYMASSFGGGGGDR